MKKIATFCFILGQSFNFLFCDAPTAAPVQSPQREMAPEEALKKLMEGNKRYSLDKSTCEDRNNARRAEIASQQKPFAAILGCSDSRVPAEIIFDQGLGEIFTIRVAGNVAGSSEVESIEYAAKHLGVSLILVLGHEGCGAVKAVIGNDAKDFPEIAALIEPAVKSLKSNQTEEAVKANIRLVVETLKKSNYLKPVIKDRKNFIQGAYYHLGSGVVELLD